MKPDLPPLRLGWQLAALTFGRFALTTGTRLVYPFLPAIARGLDVTPAQIAAILALRSLLAIPASGLGTLSERFGRKPLLIVALLLFAASNGLVFLIPTYWILGLSLTLGNLAKTVHDPVMHAHLGDTVPYARRGRAVALTEFSWAGALLIGMPLVGLIIARWGWQAPFGALALFSLLATLGLAVILPATSGAARQSLSLRQSRQLLRRYPAVWAVASYAFLLMISSELFFVVYGQWMEGQFSLSLSSLGLAAAVIGAAELTGEIGAGLLADRVGKRTTVLVMGLVAALSYMAVSQVQSSLLLALVGLYILFVGVEMAFVASIPIFSELIPEARTVALTVMMLALGVGRTLGAALSPVVWDFGGMEANGLAAAGGVLLGILILWRWAPEIERPQRQPRPGTD